jgi:hypothetical protein
MFLRVFWVKVGTQLSDRADSGVSLMATSERSSVSESGMIVRAVTVIMVTVVGLTFLFGFGKARAIWNVRVVLMRATGRSTSGLSHRIHSTKS